jgi:hypothetical protein
VCKLFLAFPLHCVCAGSLPFRTVVVTHYLLDRLLVHALLSVGGALTALSLTLQLRPQRLLSSHHFLRLPQEQRQNALARPPANR